jgi:hypothetical protein
VNDGPYTVTAKLRDGLVYTVRHDLLQYETNVSVSRLIPAAQVVIPPQSKDFPKGWKQWTDRDDRLNDIEEEEEKEVQKAAHADPLEHTLLLPL